MKRTLQIVICLLFCLLLAGCKNKSVSKETSNEDVDVPTITETVEQVVTTPEPAEKTEIVKDDSCIQYTYDPSKKFQEIDGFGAAYTWYADRLLNKNNADQAYDALFADGKMTILRFKNEYEYYMEDGASNASTMLKYYREAAKRAAEYGENVMVLMSCWSPPKQLKENNDITGAATLRKDENGDYCYDEYADWWVESIEYYQSKGIPVDYVSIQNECDFAATYDGCLFATSETDKQASYAKAYLAVYHAFQEHFGEDAPKMIGPETMSCQAGTLTAYMKEVVETAPKSIYAYAHHLYVGGESNDEDDSVKPGSFVSNFMDVNRFIPDTKKWQTEFYLGHGIDTATLINNCMIYENANAYLYWSGVWDDPSGEFEAGQLIACYNSTEDDGWRLCADYYALRHFSEFIRPGYTRIHAIGGDSDIRTSVYMNEYRTKLAMVIINTSQEEKALQLNGADYTITDSTIYQSIFGDTAESAENLFQNVGSLSENNTFTIPAKTVVTIDITGYSGEEAPVTPEIKKIELPEEFYQEEVQKVYEDKEGEKTIISSTFDLAEDTMQFESFGSSSAEYEETEDENGSGCMRVAGRSQDWNGIGLESAYFTEYGYKAFVSYDVMMKTPGNRVSATTTFTVGGSTYYPDGEDWRVYQDIEEAGVWYHVEGYVTLFSNMDEGSFKIYWESAKNTEDIYLDNINVKIIYDEIAGEYTE